MPIRHRGGGGGGEGFTLGPQQNTFGTISTTNRTAAQALRDTYATANPSWLTQYSGDREFFIRLIWNGGEALERRNVGGTAWEDVTGIIVGPMGAGGAQGRFELIIHTNAASTPTTPTGGSYVISTGVLTPPTGWTEDPVAPPVGQDIYASQAEINPSTQSGTVTPTWSTPVERSHLSSGISHVESSDDFGGTGVPSDPLTGAVTLARILDLGASPTQTTATFAYSAPTGYTAGGFLAGGQFVQFEIGTVDTPDDSDVIIRVGTDDYTLTSLGGTAVKLYEIADDTKYLGFGKADVLLLMGPTDGSGRVVDVTESGLPAASAEDIGKIFTNRIIPAAWMIHEVPHATTAVMGSFGTYTSPRNTGDTFNLYRGAHGADPTSVRVGTVDQNLDSRHLGVFYWNWRDNGFRVWTSHFDTSTNTFIYHWQASHNPADRLVSGGVGEFIGHAITDADLLRHLPQDAIDNARTYVGVATNLTGNGVIHVRTFDNSTYVAAVGAFNVYDFVTIGLYGSTGSGGQTAPQVQAAIQAALNTLVGTLDGAGLTNTGTTFAPILNVDPTQADFPTMPISKGGTGAIDAAAARTALGIIASFIKTQYESNSDTNAFTDAFSTKLTGVEASATEDQTGAEIVALLEALAGAGQLNATALRLIADAIDAELGSTTWRTGGGGGSATFLGLTDTPAAFGTTGQVAAINAGVDALEFVDQTGGGGFTTTDFFSGDIAIGTSNQWVAAGTTPVPSDAVWILFNGGSLSSDADDAPNADWKWINAADWRTLTAADAGDAVADGTGMLFVDWVSNDVASTNFTRRDTKIGRTATNSVLIASMDTAEDLIGAQIRYVVASSAVGSGGGFTLRFGVGVPSDSLGDDDDWYLNTTDGAWFQKVSGVYGTAVYTDMVGAAGTMDGVINSLALTLTGSSLTATAGRSQGADVASSALTLPFLLLAGGVLTGAVSGITPTANAHLTRKDYVDTEDALALKIAQNLADLADAAVARTNLGLGAVALLSAIGVSDLPSAAQNAVRSLSYSTANPHRLSYTEVDGGTSSIAMSGLAALAGAVFTGHARGLPPVEDADFVTLSHFNTHRGGSALPPDDHMLRVGWSDDETFDDSELTASSTTYTATIPPRSAIGYLGFWIKDQNGAIHTPSDVHYGGHAQSQIGSYEDPIAYTYSGEAGHLWRTSLRQDFNLAGDTLEVIF